MTRIHSSVEMIICFCFLTATATTALANPHNPSFRSLQKKYDSFQLKDVSGFREDIPKIQQLNKEEQLQLLDAAADSLVTNALSLPYVPSSNVSKLYYIIFETLKKEVGLPSTTLFDASVVRRDLKSIHLIAYANAPFEGAAKDERTQLYYSSTLLAGPNEKNIDIKDRRHNWTVDGTGHMATVSVKSIADANELVSKKSSPDYMALLANGKLNTLVVGDQSNVLTSDIVKNKSDAEVMLGQYVLYLQQNGFKFEVAKPYEAASYPVLQDSVQYVKKQIESATDPAHIVLKDGHNGGEDKFIFRLATKARLLRATLKRSDGIVEKFEYVFPDFNDRSTMLQSRAVSNKIFGEWMREREKKSGLELIFVNAACNSRSQAIYEVASARTKNRLFIDLATDKEVPPFSINPFSSTRILYSALRNQESYVQIRQKLEQSKQARLAAQGKVPVGFAESATYLLPNEPAYQEKILNQTIDADVQVFKQVDQKWEPVRIIGNSLRY